MHDRLFSLIIPHYNSPSLLERLLITVPQRNDLQVIVVDDCSTKDIEVYQDLKLRYRNVEFYSTSSNGGGGRARNIGLSHAIGQYVFFADSDDYFTPGINNLLDKYSNFKDYDVIFFNAQAVNSDTYLPSKRVNHLNEFISLHKNNPIKSELSLKFLFGEPWCKFIKRSLINNYDIKFEEIPVHNDTLFSYMIGYYSETVFIENLVGYCVTERPVSVSTFNFENKIYIRTEVFSRKNRFLANNKIPIFDNMMIGPFIKAYKNKKSIKQIYDIARQYGYSKLFIQSKIIIILAMRVFKCFNS